MGLLEIRLKDLYLKKMGTGQPKDRIFIVGFATDLSFTPQHIEYDGNDKYALLPEGFKQFNQFAVVSISPGYYGRKWGDKIALPSRGMLLYGPKDPLGKVCLHVGIMESNAPTRDIAGCLEQAINETQLFSLMVRIGRITNHADPRTKLLTDTTRFAFETLMYLLKQPDDDVISSFHYSSTKSLATNSYAVPQPGRYFEHSDRYVDALFDVRYRDDTSTLGEASEEISAAQE